MSMTVAEQFVKSLIEKNYHVSCAESCTGGKVTGAIVDVPDASKVLDASIVTYSNEAKMHYLGVKAETLETFGAVSEETAREMAEGANAIMVEYRRTGYDFDFTIPVRCKILLFSDSKRLVKMILAYREKESDIWAKDFEQVMRSFIWIDEGVISPHFDSIKN